jgi:hypothetical protein
VSFTVKNDGTVEGAEVPQVYLGIDYAGGQSQSAQMYGLVREQSSFPV